LKTVTGLEKEEVKVSELAFADEAALDSDSSTREVQILLGEI
jgi:hypothetical protein